MINLEMTIMPLDEKSKMKVGEAFKILNVELGGPSNCRLMDPKPQKNWTDGCGPNQRWVWKMVQPIKPNARIESEPSSLSSPKYSLGQNHFLPLLKLNLVKESEEGDELGVLIGCRKGELCQSSTCARDRGDDDLAGLSGCKLCNKGEFRRSSTCARALGERSMSNQLSEPDHQDRKALVKVEESHLSVLRTRTSCPSKKGREISFGLDNRRSGGRTIDT